MEWYQNMTGPQKKDFYKVLGVSIETAENSV